VNARPIDGAMVGQTVKALKKSSLFATLEDGLVTKIVSRGELVTLQDGESLMTAGDPADAFFVILKGNVSVCVPVAGQEAVEVAQLSEFEILGEMGVLRATARSATLIARGSLVVARFTADVFTRLFDKVPGFGLAVSSALADRVQAVSRSVPMSSVTHEEVPSQDVVSMLPADLLQRFRILPMSTDGSSLTLGFVDDPNPRVLDGVRRLLPGIEIRPVRISLKLFHDAMGSGVGVEPLVAQSTSEQSDSGDTSGARAHKLDPLLKRMVSEGASDLHLSGGQVPRWRLDGSIISLNDLGCLSDTDVYELLEPAIPERSREAFARCNDADFAYALPGVARFRVNIFRDRGGVGSVLRVIPDKILTVEQLGLPESVLRFCELPKGLVVVTGPTGSGKSTTLAAMIDHINKTRSEHIITLEDPIEFVHTSKQSLVTHREIGTHSESFSAALRAALRQDPDIVLVGEMRDLETISLAMETANTGHLVFGTLHTATAVSTIERIINVFPSSEWSQVRASLADSLKGVVAQTLCKRKGGGRIAGIEILSVNHAMQNMIRSDKTHQIPSAMSTGSKDGNTLLNVELARLVTAGKVDFKEALSKAMDKADLAQRCNQALP
jgi:twitching motility protein PilT